MIDDPPVTTPEEVAQEHQRLIDLYADRAAHGLDIRTGRKLGRMRKPKPRQKRRPKPKPNPKPRGHPPIAISPETVSAWALMIRAGATSRDLALESGFSRTTIRGRLKVAGFKFRRGRPARP